MDKSSKSNGAVTTDRVQSRISRSSSALARLFGPDWPWLVAVLLIGLAAAWPAVSQPGLLNTRGGGDSPFLLQRLHQLTVALADGHFPVRWMPDANYGYGYPFYNYYAPLSIYVAAAFRFLSFSFVRAIHLAQLAGFAAAGLGMFYLGRRWWGSRWAGLLAAAAYTVAPFHMVNVYVRGDSLAEFWAMAFFPLILLAADRLVGATTDRRLSIFALAYAALILSHNISALIFSPFLVLYLVMRVAGQVTANRRQMTVGEEQGEKRTGREEIHLASDKRRTTNVDSSLVTTLAVVGGLLLAFALAAWFFVPALVEQDLAQLGPVTEGYFHYSNHFRGLDLVQGGLLFDYNPDGGIAFRLGLVQAGLAIAGAVVVLWQGLAAVRRPPAADGHNSGQEGIRGGKDAPHSSFVIRHSSFVILCCLIAVFMITPLSQPLWDHLPLLPFTQFPWRFLSVASFFMALLAGGLVMAADRPAARAIIAATGSLVLLAAGLLGLRVDHLILTDADVTAERLAQYEWFTGNIGTTVSAEYLTPESSPRPWTSAWLNAGERDRVVAVTGELEAELIERDAAGQTWRLTAGQSGADALFPNLNWPGWRATLDGQPAELRAFPSSGLMALAVPAGEHRVTLELGRTPVRLAAEGVSLAALIGSAWLMIRRRTTGRGRQTPSAALSAGREVAGKVEQSTSSAPPRNVSFRGLRAVVCGFLLLAIFALLWRGDPEDLPRGDLSWDFAQMGYLHHTPGGIPFSNGARLYEYGYSADELTTGNTLIVTLSLAPGDAKSATLALVTPAAARPTPGDAAEPPVIAIQTVTIDGDAAIFTLPIAPDAPAGLYVPRLVLDGAQPLTPSGTTRGDLFLRPIRVATVENAQAESVSNGELGTADSESPLQASAAVGGRQSAVALDVRALTPRDATTLDGRFAWLPSRPLGGRYLVSWRAQNGDGMVLSQLDTQPGHAFNPTDGWASGGVIYDWLALRIPNALTGSPPYPLVLLLYDATTGEQLLLRRVGQLVPGEGGPTYQPVAPVFSPPEGIAPVGASFGEGGRELIWLRGYERTQTADELTVTLYWEALDDIPADFTRFVHLLDATGAVAAQVDGQPAGNSYPTGQWLKGEIVADTVRLDLSGPPEGDYRLAVGFYRPVEGLPRLDAADAGGPLADGRALLPEPVTVTAQ